MKMFESGGNPGAQGTQAPGNSEGGSSGAPAGAGQYPVEPVVTTPDLPDGVIIKNWMSSIIA